MQTYWTLTRRELAGFFCSLAGYVIIAGAALLLGLSFLVLLVKLQGQPTLMPVGEVLYDTLFFWLIPLLAAPVITMRLFALEKFSGTYETLMTTPVSDLQVVTGKFTGALVFYMIMWLTLLACIFVLRRYTSDAGGFDSGVVCSTFMGIFLQGCLLLSFGCLASALTRSQIIAAMMSFAFVAGLLLLNFLADRVPSANWQSQVLSLLSLPDQMHDFSRGVVDTRSVVLYLSLTLFFLFLTLRVVESRRWK